MDGEAVEEAAPRTPLPCANAVEDLGPAKAALVEDDARSGAIRTRVVLGPLGPESSRGEDPISDCDKRK